MHKTRILARVFNKLPERLSPDKGVQTRLRGCRRKEQEEEAG